MTNQGRDLNVPGVDPEAGFHILGHGARDASAPGSASDELDRLRAVIENAPHMFGCANYFNRKNCDCWKAHAWKADAL